MPINHPYDPRHNPKVYVSKLTEEERRARATPLENLRGLRFRSQTSTAPAANPSPPQIPTAEIAAPQDPTPEVPTVEAPTAEVPPVDVPTAEVPTPEPAMQDDPAPDYLPAAWEVVFAAFPELYPEHAEPVLASATTHAGAHIPRSQASERRRASALSSRPDPATKTRRAGSVNDEIRSEHWISDSLPPHLSSA